ncbi:hypothetical protein STEG23_002997 [Scotinomys teguina]
MVIVLLVLPFLDPKCSMASTMFMPSFTKDHMFAIQPLSLSGEDKKLGTICVWSSICHGQDARTWMLQDEVLILKLLSVDGSAASAIMACEVTTLAHESWNNSVKGRNPYIQSLPLQCSEHGSFLLSLELCLQITRRRRRPKVSPSAEMSKNTVRLALAAASGDKRDSGVCKAAQYTNL